MINQVTDEGRVILVDWAWANVLQQQQQQLQAQRRSWGGAITGWSTPALMHSAVCADYHGVLADPRVDIPGLCWLLFQIRGGLPPFRSTTSPKTKAADARTPTVDMTGGLIREYHTNNCSNNCSPTSEVIQHPVLKILPGRQTLFDTELLHWLELGTSKSLQQRPYAEHVSSSLPHTDALDGYGVSYLSILCM